MRACATSSSVKFAWRMMWRSSSTLACTLCAVLHVALLCLPAPSAEYPSRVSTESSWHNNASKGDRSCRRSMRIHIESDEIVHMEGLKPEHSILEEPIVCFVLFAVVCEDVIYIQVIFSKSFVLFFKHFSIVSTTADNGKYVGCFEINCSGFNPLNSQRMSYVIQNKVGEIVFMYMHMIQWYDWQPWLCRWCC